MNKRIDAIQARVDAGVVVAWLDSHGRGTWQHADKDIRFLLARLRRAEECLSDAMNAITAYPQGWNTGHIEDAAIETAALNARRYFIEAADES